AKLFSPVSDFVLEERWRWWEIFQSRAEARNCHVDRSCNRRFINQERTSVVIFCRPIGPAFTPSSPLKFLSALPEGTVY
ncbi:hypothetical protein AVEN_233652-1, partial [Araneus ventricosus]